MSEQVLRRRAVGLPPFPFPPPLFSLPFFFFLFPEKSKTQPYIKKNLPNFADCFYSKVAATAVA
jgi:hypothetical protein